MSDNDTLSVLDELQHHSALPWHVRQIQVSSAAVEQIAARAADEIERLHRELAEARAALRDFDEILADRAPAMHLMIRKQHAAALKAALEQT